MTDSKGRCLCGCGQKPSTTCRERKLECAGCGYVVRVTRSWITEGLPSCCCGGQLEPVCLFDRTYMPGSEGEDAQILAIRIVGEADIEFSIRSRNAKKAMQTRRRCKDPHCGAVVGKTRMYCAKHASAEMAF